MARRAGRLIAQERSEIDALGLPPPAAIVDNTEEQLTQTPATTKQEKNLYFQRTPRYGAGKRKDKGTGIAGRNEKIGPAGNAIFNVDEMPSTLVRGVGAIPLIAAELGGVPASEKLTDLGLPPPRGFVNRAIENTVGGVGVVAGVKGLARGATAVKEKAKSLRDRNVSGNDDAAIQAFGKKPSPLVSGGDVLAETLGGTAAPLAGDLVADEDNQTAQGIAAAIGGVAGASSPNVVGLTTRFIKKRLGSAHQLFAEDVAKRQGNLPAVKAELEGLEADRLALPKATRPDLGVANVDPNVGPGFASASKSARQGSPEINARESRRLTEGTAKLAQSFKDLIDPVHIPGASGLAERKRFTDGVKDIIKSAKPKPDVGNDILKKAIEAKGVARDAASQAFKDIPLDRVNVPFSDVSPRTREILNIQGAADGLQKERTELLSQIERAKFGKGGGRLTVENLKRKLAAVDQRIKRVDRVGITLQDLRGARTELAEDLTIAKGAGVPDAAKIRSLGSDLAAVTSDIEDLISRQGGTIKKELRAANDQWTAFSRTWHDSGIAPLGYRNRSLTGPDAEGNRAFKIIFSDPDNAGLEHVRDLQNAIGRQDADALVESGIKSIIRNKAVNKPTSESLRQLVTRYDDILSETATGTQGILPEVGEGVAQGIQRFQSGPTGSVSPVTELVSPGTPQAIKDAHVASVNTIISKNPEFAKALTGDMLQEIGLQAGIVSNPVAKNASLNAGQLGKILHAEGAERTLSATIGGDAYLGLQRIQRLATAIENMPLTMDDAARLPFGDMGQMMATVWSRLFATERGVVSPKFLAAEFTSRQLAKLMASMSHAELLHMYDEMLHSPNVLGQIASIERIGEAEGLAVQLAKNARRISLAARTTGSGAVGATSQRNLSTERQRQRDIGTPPPPPTGGATIVDPRTPRTPNPRARQDQF